MAEPLSAVLAIGWCALSVLGECPQHTDIIAVKSTWQAIEFARNTAHAANDARQLWERTQDLFIFIKKIETVVQDHPEPLDKDIVPIVQKALTASNRTLDRLARRCLNLGDREDLALVHRITRPIYFTLSSKSIQKFEHELQMHIMSVQMAFYLLDRGDNQESTRRIESLIATLEAHVGQIARHTRVTDLDLLGRSHLSSQALENLDNRLGATKSTLTSPCNVPKTSPAQVADETEAADKSLQLLTPQETRASRSVHRELSGTTIDNESTHIGSSTAIIEAIVNHSSNTFHQLLADGIGINGTDAQGHTPLMHTIFQHGRKCKECLNCLGKILECNVDTDKDCKGETALHMAIRHSHLDAAKMLVQRGADVNASFPDTPLMLAVKDNQYTFVALLLEHQADLNVVDKADWGLIHHAVWRNSRKALLILLEKAKAMGLRMNLDTRCKMDWTPLMHLAENAQRPANVHFAQMLLDNGAEVDATDMCGYSALYYTITIGAASPQRNEFLRLLLERGANMDAVRSKVSKRVINRFPALRRPGAGPSRARSP